MHITIGMIVLNEEEYIYQNLHQHYRHVHKIVIVEGADRLYPKDHVTKDGLSTDKTAELIRSFPDPDKKIKFIQHGWISKTGPQAKCELRDRYLQETPAGLLVVIDADEFYRHQDLDAVIDTMRRHPRYVGYQVPQIHFWKGLHQFITGGYYNVPHTRFWHVKPGDKYEHNHNYPSRGGHHLGSSYIRRRRPVIASNQFGEYIQYPCCYHFGFAKREENVRDKNAYYVNRGEKVTRPKTFRSRNAWFSRDTALGNGLVVHRYGGLLPECFLEDLKPSDQVVGEGLAVVGVAS